MNEIATRRRTTVHDVARAAAVSLATVDRVLNNRPGVRPLTAKKVEDAILALGFQRDLSASLLARARDLRVDFLIPDGSNEFMESLAEAIARRAANAQATACSSKSPACRRWMRCAGHRSGSARPGGLRLRGDRGG